MALLDVLFHYFRGAAEIMNHNLPCEGCLRLARVRTLSLLLVYEFRLDYVIIWRLHM